MPFLDFTFHYWKDQKPYKLANKNETGTDTYLLHMYVSLCGVATVLQCVPSEWVNIGSIPQLDTDMLVLQIHARSTLNRPTKEKYSRGVAFNEL